jgi:hypothetical protein
MKSKWIFVGRILIVLGFGIPVITVILSSGFDPTRGFLSSVSSLELVFDRGSLPLTENYPKLSNQITQSRKDGFSDEEIYAEIRKRWLEAKKGGYSDKEIEEWLGLPSRWIQARLKPVGRVSIPFRLILAGSAVLLTLGLILILSTARGS